MTSDFLLYREIIASDLAQFEFCIKSNRELTSAQSKSYSTVLLTTGYGITIKRTSAPTGWLPKNMRVDRAAAWLIYITKINSMPEQLSISFQLSADDATVQVGPDTGQHLVAVEFENGSKQVHIGTQDEEVFHSYSQSAWVPKRLEAAFAHETLLITTITKQGLLTQIPELLENEPFYLHYIFAESPRIKSVDYPDEWDVSTWYAVGQTKASLEAAWSKQVGAE